MTTTTPDSFVTAGRLSKRAAFCPRTIRFARWCALGVAGLTLAAPRPVAANPDAPPRASDEAPQTPSPEVTITEKARAHFRAGVNLLQDPDGARYEEAYRQFKAAYAESPSWKILGNLGVTAMKLERDGEAIDAFERYLTEGGDDVTAQERDQFQRDIETLRASVATVTITGHPKGLTVVDERITHRGGNVRNQYQIAGSESLTLRIRPGYHKLTARFPGYQDSEWELDASATGTYEHAFDLEKPAPQGVHPSAVSTVPSDSGTYRPVPTGVWIGVGVTSALTVGAVVTGAMALGRNEKYDDSNVTASDDAAGLRKQVKTLNLATDALIGAAVVAGAATTVFYLLRPERTRPATAVRITPVVSPKGGALLLSKQFSIP